MSHLRLFHELPISSRPSFWDALAPRHPRAAQRHSGRPLFHPCSRTRLFQDIISLNPSLPLSLAAKKKNKKGKTLTLTDFLAEDGGGGGGPTYIPKPVSWADETDDLEGDVSTTWHSNDDDVYRAPPIDRSLLPTAPRAAREPNIDRSRLPKSPPYTAFLGNLPYDVTEESIKDFFRGLNVSKGLERRPGLEQGAVPHNS
ncbi:PREDICTED: eukaryotic translation initiation factor 4B-like [Tinamus guttatus]|uniref:eukaryotic translation initiation factor 4B-like n=1 Tax=Tinamus guttatus TaxID=94827 RepID=UPI00052ED5EA|nr:PREDICTED: eukaryotic translation initiation factor 4B-like [Tinamus guttatus]